MLRISLTKEEQAALQKRERRANDPTEVRRCRAILLNSRGWRVGQIAELFDRSVFTIRRDLHRYKRNNLKGLATKPRSGRPSKVTDELRDELARLVSYPPRTIWPDDEEFRTDYWTLELFKKHIMKTRHLALSLNCIRQALLDRNIVLKRYRNNGNGRRSGKGKHQAEGNVSNNGHH